MRFPLTHRSILERAQSREEGVRRTAFGDLAEAYWRPSYHYLRLHWRHGARWFWDTLVDADLANNTQGWQWTAGTGVDAAPYFRIFNPVTQAKKFDPDGAYIARWLPELAAMLGAKRPMRVPRFIGRLAAGQAGVVLMTELRGASNAKAKRELGWHPAHSSWREGLQI